jgi:hypothetical protein
MAVQLFQELIDENGHLEIPAGTRNILPNVLMNCENLTSVVIPKGVTIVGTCSFLGCKNLRHVELPEGLRTIDVGAFMGCTSLESIVIPEGVQIIAHDAFQDCTGLTSIVIPRSINVIGEGAFEGCTCLTDDDLSLIAAKASPYDVLTISTTACVVGPRETIIKVLNQAFHLFGSDKIVVDPDANLEELNRKIDEANYRLDGDPDLEEQPEGYGAEFTLLDFLDVQSKINSLCEYAVLSYIDEEHPDGAENYGVGLTDVTKDGHEYILKILSRVNECQDTYCDEEWCDWCERMIRLYGCKIILHREEDVYETDIHNEETRLFQMDGNSVKQTVLDTFPYADPTPDPDPQTAEVPF